MEPFKTHTGVGVPLRRSNVDTDQIIPAVYLKRVSRTGFEDALFAAWRSDEDFILNQEPFRAGSVLVAGPDFGTGSSREHAVIAPRYLGLRAVIAKSFARIHWQNLANFGILALQFDDDADYEAAQQGDVVVLEDLRNALTGGRTVKATIGGRETTLHHSLSERQVEMVLAGGRIPLTAQSV